MLKKYFIFLAVFLMGVLAFRAELSAKVPTADQMLFSSAQGREFFIAIPPNEDDRQPLGNTQELALEIYVTSSKNCTVTLEIPGINKIVTKKVTAYNITTFSSLMGDLTFQLEVRQSEVPLDDKGLFIHADQPISVYVLNHRNVTADGFLAIPISSCGTDYIHCAYYDLFENLAGGEYRGGGFLIIASEDNTKCNIALKGRGATLAKTQGGHKIGDTWQVTLQKGQVYEVSGDGTTRGQFDITGSRVTTNKPVGFISYHKRVLIPSFDLFNGRNMLCEMIPPVPAWGKKYVTVEFKRQNRGDFFRIVAAQDNTNFSVKWYDLKTSNLIGQRSGNMKKSGDFFEYEEVFVPQGATNTLESIRGSSVWEADKPVLVMQYSYSQNWDNDPNFDPFMILVVPTEQFIPGTVFQTPASASGFLDNYFNIVAVGDTNDPAQTKLQTIAIDGKQVWQIDGGFLFNRIPTTNLYWSKLNMQPGAHRITGDTKFGGYIYGFSSADGYGWPAAMAIGTVGETDTLPPELTISGDCGDYSLRTTEFRNGKAGDDPRQVDLGIAAITMSDSSYNYQMTLLDSITSSPKAYSINFLLKVKDKSKPAKAIFEIYDWAGNVTIDSVSYSPATFSIDQNPIAFGDVRLRTTKSLKVSFTNTSQDSIHISRVALYNGTVFKITAGSAPPEFSVAPNESHDVFIDYTPVTEGISPDQKDWDSLIVETHCLPFSWPINGRGVIPKILVEDYDFGAIQVNQTACMETQRGTGLKVQNVGSMDLVITGIQNFAPPFSLTNTNPPLPITIPVGGAPVYLTSVCFTPTVVGPFTQDILFQSNAEGIDSIATLKGVGIIPGPYVTNKDWQERRVKTVNDSVVFIRNSGSSKVTLTGINLGSASADFQITGAAPMPSTSSPVDLMPDTATSGTREIVVNVRFTPQGEATYHNTVVPEFDPSSGIPAGSVFGNLDGIGILPKIEVVGYEFQPPILVGTTHPDQGTVTIRSKSTSADLWVESINWKNPAQSQFAFIGNVPSNIKIPRGTEIKLPVQFTAKATGKQVEIVSIVSDASEGPDPNPRVTNDTVVIGYGFDKGINIDSVDYGTALLCDQPVKQLHLVNTATTSDAVIQGFQFVSGDVNAFEILTATPFTLAAGKTANIDVRFKPYAKVPMSFSAVIRVYSNVDSTHYALVTGKADTLAVQFSLQKYSESDKLQPGDVVPIAVSIQPTRGAWQDAKITSFHVEYVYNKDWMIYSGKIDKGGLLDGTWNVTAKEIVIDGTNKALSVDGTGTTPISASGVLAIPRFMLLLSNDFDFVPSINDGASSLGSRDVCITRTSVPGYVIMNTCVKALRTIYSSGLAYQLYTIDPNPVSGNSVNVKYDVGLSGSTSIQLINQLGEVVRDIVNETKRVGNYQTSVDIANIPSGVYFLKMRSGPYTDLKQVVITK